MIELATCGTCGKDGDKCEYMIDDIGIVKACRAFPWFVIHSSYTECKPHIAYREQKKRAERYKAQLEEFTGEGFIEWEDEFAEGYNGEDQ